MGKFLKKMTAEEKRGIFAAIGPELSAAYDVLMEKIKAAHANPTDDEINICRLAMRELLNLATQDIMPAINVMLDTPPVQGQHGAQNGAIRPAPAVDLEALHS